MIVPISAQTNIKTGYIGARLHFQELSDIIDEYNQTFETNIEEDLGSLAYTNGVSIGLRHRFDLSAVEFSYEFGLKNSNSTATDLEESIKLKYRHHNLGFAFLQYFGEGSNNGFNIGLKPSIHYNFFNINGEQNERNKKDLLRLKYFSYRISLQIDLPSASNQGITLQPFVEFAFGTEENLDGLSNYLQAATGKSGLPTRFGFQIILYNGAQ